MQFNSHWKKATISKSVLFPTDVPSAEGYEGEERKNVKEKDAERLPCRRLQILMRIYAKDGVSYKRNEWVGKNSLMLVGWCVTIV